MVPEIDVLSLAATWNFSCYSQANCYGCIINFQDNMATMHDILDAQWMYDNSKDGKCNG